LSQSWMFFCRHLKNRVTVSVANILWRANILAISFTLQQGKLHKMQAEKIKYFSN
jgi:hypothetical protein